MKKRETQCKEEKKTKQKKKRKTKVEKSTNLPTIGFLFIYYLELTGARAPLVPCSFVPTFVVDRNK